MSSADSRGHYVTRFIVGVVAACSEPATGPSRAELLAAADALDGQPAAALAALPAVLDAPILARRAELLDRLGRVTDAQDELARAIALAPDPALLAQRRRLAVTVAARRGDGPAIERVIAQTPLPEQPSLAYRAVSDAPVTSLPTLARESAELAAAAARRIEETQGPAAALGPRERWVYLDPADADAWDAVARSRIAAGHVDDALAAWDHAIAIAPAQPAFRVAPVQALVLAGEHARAKQRATTLATEARRARNPELLVAASAAASHVDASLALALARDAQAIRPSDGRLAFLVAQRLAEAGDSLAAARAYTALLVCGAHGRPWHRHEVAAKLQELGSATRTALDETRTCEAVDAADLAPYLASLRSVH